MLKSLQKMQIGRCDDIRTVFISGADTAADTPGYPRIPTGYPPQTVADTPWIPLSLPNVNIINTASFSALVNCLFSFLFYLFVFVCFVLRLDFFFLLFFWADTTRQQRNYDLFGAVLSAALPTNARLWRSGI